MKIALKYAAPSPEAALIAGILKSHREWQVTDVGEPTPDATVGMDFDLAVCVGPVRSRPLASRHVLFVLGPVRNHLCDSFDVAVVTNPVARDEAQLRCGYRTRITMIEPALVGLNAGCRQAQSTDQPVLLHAGPLCDDDYSQLHAVAESLSLPLNCMCLWAAGNAPGFDLRRFNSAVRGGAIGLYLRASESDVQIRRHLALGGRVVCPPDEVLSDLTKHCVWGDGLNRKDWTESGLHDTVDGLEGDVVQYAEAVTAALQLC